MPETITHENSLPAGAMVGKYQVDAILGHGGFGITYKAIDTVLNRTVAIKEYMPQDLVVRKTRDSKVTAKSSSDREAYRFGLQRFLDETRTLAGFRHVNIVRVLDFFEANDTAYMVMEFEHGLSLGDRLDELPPGQPLPFNELDQWLDGILDGLFAVHKKGILHRDIKPDNIYIRRDGSPMLIDFGAARYALSSKSKSLSVVLTPGYAPNEQYSSSGRQGPYTDIYALGGVLYRCITGRDPVEAPERMQTVFAEGGEDPQPAAVVLGRGYPANLLAAVDAALGIRPMDRPPGVPQFRELLAGRKTGSPEPEPKAEPAKRKKTIKEEKAEKKDPPSVVPTQSNKKKSSNKKLLFGGLGLLFCFGALLIFLGGGENGDNEPSPGDTWTDPTTGVEFVYIKGGCYQMGDTFGDGQDDEKPVHEVCVDDFYMGKYEVTQGEWLKIMDDNPSGFKKGDTYPVETVSWDDTQEYIKKLNSRSGKKYRLPTEAEWEYAARSGGKKEKYSGGSDVDAVGWYGYENAGKSIHPVGQKQRNGLGLYDMSGNVWEWCSDWYGEDYYKTSPRDNPQGPSSGRNRVKRGGSWFSCAGSLRSAVRYYDSPGNRFNVVGFRLLRTP